MATAAPRRDGFVQRLTQAKTTSAMPDARRETVRKCLAEIRQHGTDVPPWRKLHNGMTVGEFAYLYIHHYRNGKNARPH